MLSPKNNGSSFLAFLNHETVSPLKLNCILIQTNDSILVGSPEIMFSSFPWLVFEAQI